MGAMSKSTGYIDSKWTAVILGCLLLAALMFGSACNTASGDQTAKQEAPPPANVVVTEDASLFTVDHPEQFALATADMLLKIGEADFFSFGASWPENHCGHGRRLRAPDQPAYFQPRTSGCTTEDLALPDHRRERRHSRTAAVAVKT